ncbi:acyl-CoA-binding protein [Dyella monticola]|uniref:Acyl-CoA-binding protein n=1 Tax=Dyella monticola TaxID=1927958 RepID=A0A370WUH3_9GAMM|nr:acyl-CoA-binding protein [Dyella monticola]RDS79605.1 acyl-CoA-binding protein [Dyella monticola]
MNELHSQFHQAANDVRQRKERPDNDTLLALYGLYKQALEGDVHDCEPTSFFDFIGTAKQEAWARLKGVPQEEAMRQYIALVRQLLD